MGGINYCNVTIGAALSWKPRIIRLQLQFFFRIPGGINYCNVTLHFYMILSFRNIICNNFVPNGKWRPGSQHETPLRLLEWPFSRRKVLQMNSDSNRGNPLIFFSLPFWKKKTRKKPTKTARILSRLRTPKILGKEAKKNSKKQGFPWKDKSKEIQNGKEKKIGDIQTGA